jgi:hypothetical protein
MQMSSAPHALVIDGPGGRKVAMLLTWEHAHGGQARCLARLALPQTAARPVAVLSELAENPRGLGLASDVPGAARAFQAQMSSYAVLEGPTVVWLLHHGSFSSADAYGAPETFTRVAPAAADAGLTGASQQLLTPGEVLDDIAPLDLSPVEAVLDELRSVRI